MLEIAHLWNKQEVDPRRSIMYVAWPGQVDIELTKAFFENRFAFSHLITSNPYENVSADIIVQLDYAGAGSDILLIHPRSSKRLTELINETASINGLAAESRIDSPDFTDDSISSGTEWMSLRWADAQTSPLDDQFEYIDQQRLESFGRTLTLALINLVREADY